MNAFNPTTGSHGPLNPILSSHIHTFPSAAQHSNQHLSAAATHAWSEAILFLGSLIKLSHLCCNYIRHTLYTYYCWRHTHHHNTYFPRLKIPTATFLLLAGWFYAKVRRNNRDTASVWCSLLRTTYHVLDFFFFFFPSLFWLCCPPTQQPTTGHRHNNDNWHCTTGTTCYAPWFRFNTYHDSFFWGRFSLLLCLIHPFPCCLRREGHSVHFSS